jgi:hypothetical protein
MSDIVCLAEFLSESGDAFIEIGAFSDPEYENYRRREKRKSVHPWLGALSLCYVTEVTA